ncbi:hypothetical protein FRC10_010590 [Ceratobasidium sp. 414]|nr:hypothetical protein FRC10_010590 [Ceratobasidium sp. 414]
MANIPLQEWPADLTHVREKFTRLYQRNPRYASSWFGGLLSMFNFVFPPTAPCHFGTHPQFVLRPPVPGGFPLDDAPGLDLADPELGPPGDEDVPEADFIIDQDFQAGGRGFILLVGVMASATPTQGDFARFLRNVARLQEIAEAGGPVRDTTAMLIAGGRVYTWNFAHLPKSLRQEDLLQMGHIGVDSVEFLNCLIQVRNGFPQ